MHSVRLLLLLVFALLSSCAKQGIRHDLKQMMSQPIVMPDELEMVLADTVIACVQSASSKCIVYLDSADCMSCRVEKLVRYTALYNSGNKTPVFDLMVLVSPKVEEKKHVTYLIQQSSGFPVYIDTQNKFLQLNPHIPGDSRYHSFLTDRNGKVIFVGDPTSSDGLMELFLEALRTIH